MKEGLEHKIVLHEKSFDEAGGKKVFPDLNVISLVIKINHGEYSNTEANRDKIKQLLTLNAACVDATHVFSLTYLFDSKKEHLYGAVGTAYRSQKSI